MRFTSLQTATSLASNSIATIGHSNRSLDEFIGMLQGAKIDLLLDVRSFPRSRKNPAFNIDSLPEHLARYQISYRHLPQLGGRRPLQRAIDPQKNAWWTMQSFHNYADYALSPAFSQALEQVIALAKTNHICLMCAEAVWWRCHRRIISDYLLIKECRVEHLISPNKKQPAFLSAGALPTADGKLVYPKAGSA